MINIFDVSEKLVIQKSNFNYSENYNTTKTAEKKLISIKGVVKILIRRSIAAKILNMSLSICQ